MSDGFGLRRNKAVRLGSDFPTVPAALALVATLLQLVLLLPSAPRAQAQDPSTKNIREETVSFESAGFKLEAFVAEPSGGGKHPAVLVIHDSQGLNESIRGVAREFASSGYVALAPDFTSRAGGTRTSEQMAAAVSQLQPRTSLEDARSAFAYLHSNAEVDAEKISVVGFGWGGWRGFMLAGSTPEMYRAVIYCGTTPPENADSLRAPVLAHYAQFDFRTTGNAIVTERALARAGKKFSYFVYPQVNRGFYLAGAQYNADAAKLAWSRTLEFLK